MSDVKSDRIEELERLISELKARLPKHTPPVSMLVELDELDEALEQARVEMKEMGQAWAGAGPATSSRV